MTSAINGKIIFKQDNRSYLNANMRANSLVFDTDNNILLYSPSGTSYYEFYPGQTSGGGGSASAVSWQNVTSVPVASNSTSGVITLSDWNKFNSKADVSAIPSTSSFVTSSYVNTQIQNIPTASTNTSGLLTSANWNTFNNKADVSAISWANITNKPTASNTTSGVLTSSDWVKFNAKADLSAVSGGGTVNSVTVTSTNITISNPTITTSGNIGVNLTSVVSSGTSTKVVYDQFGRITSGGPLIASDIPSLSSIYISVGSISNASTNTSGYLTSSDWNKFNIKADVSAIPSTSSFVTSSYVNTQIQNIPFASSNTSGVLTSSDWNKFNAKADLSAVSAGSGVTSSDYFNNPDPVIQIFSSRTTSAAVQGISSASEFPFWSVGYRTKLYSVTGPTSGNYQATIVFYGASHSDGAWTSANTISATITSAYNSVSEFYTNKLTKWSAQLIIDSGTIPAPGISASVEV